MMKRHADRKCQTCPQEDETVQHFLMECPAQSSLRRAIRDKINPLELSSMLSNTASVELIYQWICKNLVDHLPHYEHFVCCFFFLLFFPSIVFLFMLSYSSRYAEDINKILQIQKSAFVLPHCLMIKTSASQDGSTDSNPGSAVLIS